MDVAGWVLIICLFVMVAMITWVDFHSMRIPDSMNIGVFVAGVFFVLSTNSELLIHQFAFALIIFAAFWSFQVTHRKLSGRTGLGLGDVKMFGAASVWITPFFFPIFLFSASATALLFAVIWLGVSKHDFQQTRIPFGPFIGAGLLFTVLIQEHILQS